MTSADPARCGGMADEDEERMARPDGHRYDAPESEDERRSKEWTYGFLGIVFVILMILIATGTVPIFPH